MKTDFALCDGKRYSKPICWIRKDCLRYLGYKYLEDNKIKNPYQNYVLAYYNEEKNNCPNFEDKKGKL